MNRIPFFCTWFVVLVGLFTTSVARAQTSGLLQQADSVALNQLYVDFAAPDLAAPTLLGVTASQISKPANVRALAGSLLGAAAGLQTGAAGLGLEVAPIKLLGHPVYRNPQLPTLTNTPDVYGNALNRIVRGITLSGASITAETNARVAVGAAVVLVDKTDPLLDRKRVAAIDQRFRELVAIKYLHGVLATRQTAAITRVNALFQNNGLNANSATFKNVAGRLRVLAGLPVPDTLADSARFTGHRTRALTAWNKSIDSLARLRTSPLTPTQVTTLKNEAANLVAGALADYPRYNRNVTLFETSTQLAVKQANDEFAKRLWNATIVQAGTGWTWRSTDQRWQNLASESKGFFLRAALRPADNTWADHPVGSVSHFLYYHVQLVGLLQYNGYQKASSELPIAAVATTDSLQHKWTYGGRLLIGGAWFRVSGEYAIQNLTYTTAVRAASDVAKRTLRDNLHTATLGAEFRLADKLWLEFAFGTTYSADERKDAKLLTLANFKYALRNNQRFKTN